MTEYASKFGGANVSWADASLALSNYAERNGWPDDLLQAVDAWHSTVSARGGDPNAIAPLNSRRDPKAVEARRAEIESLMRTDPRAYWGNALVQDELMQLCEPQDVPQLEGPR